jgi:hypothetical protein
MVAHDSPVTSLPRWWHIIYWPYWGRVPPVQEWTSCLPVLKVEHRVEGGVTMFSMKRVCTSFNHFPKADDTLLALDQVITQLVKALLVSLFP